uniref:Methionyl-tRNA formyltransferase n=1 Tax=Anthurium amnicola TaxID=1678845 RepID=A0A1D1Z6J6_9ARAE
MMGKTRNMLEELVKEGSFKWILSRRTSFEEEFEEMGRSPSGRRKWISELSSIANVIVGRCSRILDVSMDELQHNFDMEASDSIKHPSCYARNFLEYCCFRAIALSIQVTGYLTDKNFRRLTFDMMLAWEAPAAASEPVLKVDKESTVGIEAFSRIAPAVAIIADVITSANIFDVLASSTGGRLSFSIYDKYLVALDRAIKKMKTQSESSHLSSLRIPRGERILDMDGTLTTQPVLEHVGMSIWPGRLTLTDHALYFEALRVVTYDKAKVYDLADDLKQVIKPELTGPWGARLFDKGVMYKSISLSEPVVLEFPELTGHSRRDYWLAICREIFYAHKFIREYEIKGIEREETLSKAVLGILRLQALEDLSPAIALQNESLLMFNLADQLPGGDLILETLASMTALRESDRANEQSSQSGMHSISALAIFSNLGLVPQAANKDGLLVGEIIVGEMSSLERAVRESRDNFKAVELAQASVNGVKVEGIDTNLAVMKELLYPLTELGRFVLSLVYWDDPLKSLFFCTLSSYVIYRDWLGHVFVMLLLFMAVFMLITRFCGQGRLEEVKVKAPPPMNTVEQLLAVQNAISQVEELAQDGNIVLLKLRSLLLAVPPQATRRVIPALLLVALVMAFLPRKCIILLVFLELFTRYSPPRRAHSEWLARRLREWWFSIPAAPVVLEKETEEKKRR